MRSIFLYDLSAFGSSLDGARFLTCAFSYNISTRYEACAINCLFVPSEDAWTIVSFLKVRSFLKTFLNLKNTCKIESLLIKEIVSICGGNSSGVDRLWAQVKVSNSCGLETCASVSNNQSAVFSNFSNFKKFRKKAHLFNLIPTIGRRIVALNALVVLRSFYRLPLWK